MMKVMIVEEIANYLWWGGWPQLIISNADDGYKDGTLITNDNIMMIVTDYCWL